MSQDYVALYRLPLLLQNRFRQLHYVDNVRLCESSYLIFNLLVKVSMEYDTH